MITDLPLLLVVCGPTASGKTDTALTLAQYFGTEIISADSRQFYKEMTVGTAVPTKAQLAEVSHHFIGNLSIHEPTNISRYESEVLTLLSRLFDKFPLVVMVGGSGLYINAVCHGIDLLPDPDPAIRSMLQETLEKRGVTALQEMLERLDPVYFGVVDRHNPVRLIRAIEVCLTTGVPYSSLRSAKRYDRNFSVFKVGLTLPKEVLNHRINTRVDAMMESGLLEEARLLFPYRHLSTLNTVGYRELFSFFKGEISLDEAVDKIKTNTRRYAKRQMTWFKKDQGIKWFDPDYPEKVIAIVQTMINDQSFD